MSRILRLAAFAALVQLVCNVSASAGTRYFEITGPAPQVIVEAPSPATGLPPATALGIVGGGPAPIARGLIVIDDQDTPDGADDLIGGTVEIGTFRQLPAPLAPDQIVGSLGRVTERLARQAPEVASPNAAGGLDYVVVAGTFSLLLSTDGGGNLVSAGASAAPAATANTQTPQAAGQALPATGTETPVAVDDGVEINFGRLTPIDVLANDTGLADKPIVIEITQQPAYGSVEVETEAGTFVTYTYTDAASFPANDSFRYQLRDADGEVSNEATVTIFPINVLTAQNDPDGFLTPDGDFRTTRDRPVTVDVMTNDGGLLNAPILLTITATAFGTAVVNADSTVTFTPDSGFTGTDAGFQYQIADSTGATSLATANIQVFPGAVTDSGGSSLDPALLVLLAGCILWMKRQQRR